MCEYVKESHVNSDIFSLEVLLLWKLCYIDHIWDFQIRVCSSTWLIVDLTLGYQSAPLVMPSGKGYFRQAELFLIPEYSYTGEDSYTRWGYLYKVRKVKTNLDHRLVIWSWRYWSKSIVIHVMANNITYHHMQVIVIMLFISKRHWHYDHYHHHTFIMIIPGLFWA